MCVQQTALELLRRGKQVLVAADVVSSQRRGDRERALTLMLAAGASVSTLESIVMQLLETANHSHFKEVSKLLIAHNNGFVSGEKAIDRLD